MGEKKFQEGSTGAGIKAVCAFLTAKGVDLKGFQMADGSGLSRKNTMTTKQMVSLLVKMRSSEPFYQSLREYPHGVRAKGGSMLLTRSFAGYAGDIAFAVFINFGPSFAEMQKAIDAFVEQLTTVNRHYKEIIEFLAHVRFATRKEISNHLKITSNGTLTKILKDVELCGFIEKYTSYNLNAESHLARYCISDQYLQFYYKFIKPIDAQIQQGKFQANPVEAIQFGDYQKWLGFAFERFCRRRHFIIAKILGFHGVRYRSGALYNKTMQTNEPGFQFDLVFDRDDRVMTLCEIKYSGGKIGTSVIDEFESKLDLLPDYQKKTLHKVLITIEGASEALVARHYFDRVIVLDELFAADV